MEVAKWVVDYWHWMCKIYKKLVDLCKILEDFFAKLIYKSSKYNIHRCLEGAYVKYDLKFTNIPNCICTCLSSQNCCFGVKVLSLKWNKFSDKNVMKRIVFKKKRVIDIKKKPLYVLINNNFIDVLIYFIIVMYPWKI